MWDLWVIWEENCGKIWLEKSWIIIVNRIFGLGVSGKFKSSEISGKSFWKVGKIMKNYKNWKKKFGKP